MHFNGFVMVFRVFDKKVRVFMDPESYSIFMAFLMFIPGILQGIKPRKNLED